MEKLKKADTAAKTTEAWWALLVSDGSLGQTIFRWIWPVIGGGLGAGVAAATSWISSYGVAGWAATIALGSLTAIWAMAGIETVRTRRYLRSHDQSQFTEAPSPGGERVAIERAISDRLKALDSTQNEHKERVLKSLGELQARIKEIGARQASFESLAGDLASSSTARFAKLEHDLKNLVEYVEQRAGSLSERFKNVDDAFGAILNRELHERLFGELAADFERLAEPVRDGKGIVDDAAWQKQVRDWRSDLDQWLIYADYYAMGAKEKITQIPDFLYDGEWTFDETRLTANQVHRFKEVGIWWHNAKEEKPRIDKCFVAAAFYAPSKKGRLDYPPRPGEDQ